MNINELSHTEQSQPSSNPEVMENFDFLPQVLRDVLAAQGITEPTSIQARAIPAALTGRDILAQSSTGSGKTLAFSLPVALRLKKHGGLRALILTPTRELATQVAAVLDSTVSALKLRTLAITGGSSYSRQRRALQEGVDIVVGTPGRMNDLLNQGVLELSQIESFVLDEVDQMLDFGFAEDLEKIRAQLSPKAQTLFFSATLSPEIRAIARKTLKDPIEVNIAASGAQSPSTIQHKYLEVRGYAEQKALINALLFHNPVQAIVFCKTRQECAELTDALMQRGFDAAALHGDLTQVERNQTMDKFREKKLKYLIATNVAARGIDVQDLPLVVNFNVPFDTESYTHRVGRTGRNGAAGEAWTIVTPSSVRSYEFIMRKLKIKPEAVDVPSASEVIHRSAEGLVAELKVAREKPFSKTIQKAVERTVGQLSAEEKDLILQEMVGRRLEKLDVYYNDDIKMTKPLVRLDQDFSEKRSWGDRLSRGDAPRGKGGDRFRGGERSFGGPKRGKPAFGQGKPKFGQGEGKPQFGKPEGKPHFSKGEGKPHFGKAKPFSEPKKKGSEIRSPQQ
ncbi:MAG: DEAD/DEAH box helicase [Betaproteobacteria bacterium]|nr:DEAD/DEAH box helicase [Betaproteobacteria bacterium]